MANLKPGIMSPTNMLDLQKLVLEHVYDNSFLFAKELNKSFEWLDHDDLAKLYAWSTERFHDRYKTLIEGTFSEHQFHKNDNC